MLGALIIEPAQQWLTLQYTNEYLSEILLGALFLAGDPGPAARGHPHGRELIAKFRARLARGRAGPRRRAAPGGRRGAAAGRAGRARRPAGPKRAGARPAATGSRRDRPAAGRGRVQGVRRRPGAAATARSRCEQGSITGLIGPNGSGKTTLFNIMTGYERVDSGDVYLGDRKITNRPPQRVFAPRHRPDLPAHPDLPPADRAWRTCSWPRSTPTGAAPQPAGPGGRARRPAARHGTAGVHRDRRPRRRAGRDPVLRAAQAARAVLRAGRRSRRSCCSTSPPAG